MKNFLDFFEYYKQVGIDRERFNNDRNNNIRKFYSNGISITDIMNIFHIRYSSVIKILNDYGFNYKAKTGLSWVSRTDDYRNKLEQLLKEI